MDRLPNGAGKFLPTSARENVSGMASNAATGIARLGGKVTLWAAVGEDAVGGRLIATLEAEGIDCSAVQRVTGASSAIATVVVDHVGERMIIPYYAPTLLSDPHLPTGIERKEFAVVMADVRWPLAAEMAMAAARRAGTPAVLDADTAPPEIAHRLAPLATYIVASAPGAAVLCGDGTPAELARRLAARFPVHVAVTAGPGGAYWFDRAGKEVRHVPAPKIDAVDTTAAGDVFHGAFALALTEGRDMAAALRFATAAAALKCTRFGGRLGAPDRAETDAFAATMAG
jgi:sulfofructose kinase